MLPLLGLATSVAVCPAGFEAAIEPQVATSGSEVYVAFGMGSSVFVSRSDDGGKSYGKPVEVAGLSHLMLGMRRGPRIATSGAIICVTAVGKLAGDAKDELYAWNSTDHGATWTGPTRINDVPGAAREGLDGLAAGGGKFVCAWLDVRTPGTKLYSATSRDGRTWSPGIAVYTSASGSICECCHPSVAVDGSGNITYFFRNSLSGYRDMYLLPQNRPASKVGEESWRLDACPMDGGDITLTKTGKPYVIFRRGEMIYASYDGRTQESFGLGRQPVVTMGRDRPICAFVSNEGRLIQCHPGDQLYSTVSNSADDPSIDSIGGKAILVWTEKGSKPGIRSLLVN